MVEKKYFLTLRTPTASIELYMQGQQFIIRLFFIALIVLMIGITYTAANYGWWVVPIRNPVIMQQYRNEYDYTAGEAGYSGSRSKISSGRSISGRSFRSSTSGRSFSSGSRSGGGK
ncbi:MAG: hypothetical protein NZ551_07580 [Microscillaceae bacterium]|nr:hypothetical protein [Microscillaceae bacterium]MDW8461056.1 hypothetical protein [Cytophagales bacterium]